jgi:hypothetical protein
MSTPRTISELITNLVSLTESLPASIPNALHDGKINHVLMTVEGEEPFETFNRRFDILFGEHCRDENGRLVHIQRGKYGMDAVCKYLKTMTWEGFPLDIVKIKLDRIVAEVVYLVYVILLPIPKSLTNCHSSNAPDDAPTNVSNDASNNQLGPTRRVNLVVNNPKKSQPSHASKDKRENVEKSRVNKPAPLKAKKTKEKPTKLVDLLDGLF